MKFSNLPGKASLLALTFLIANWAIAQNYRWQQRVAYDMDIKLDVNSHQFTGTQKLTYYNNSPDTLRRVFYHLYFNAFQPGSMMDVRSLNISDPDHRVMDRISKLKDDEIGYHHITSLKQDGKTVKFDIEGTIMVVNLNKPILPKAKAVFDMKFESQVPLQIRRSGRDSKEGISYSMSQWYPKISEYDYQGWHANPYIGREFHGVWGDFDVKLTLDPKFVVAASGLLQNAKKVGYGYESQGETVKRPKGDLTWYFKAENVHDFVWAADPDYTHVTTQVPNGPKLHFFYQKNEKTEPVWDKLPEYTKKTFEFVSENFGKYPFPTYSVIQGGDGGMEYPMATLITGERPLQSLVGVTVHEILHSWYQGVLATNESLFAWMDEGFTSYASAITTNYLFQGQGNPHLGTYNAFFNMLKNQKAEPLRMHADHYEVNNVYSINSYVKGAIFLHQLGYVIGQDVMMKGMRRYFNAWKFKHPNPDDLMRIMEKQSGLELDWYFEHFINTTNTVDYGITNVGGTGNKTFVELERLESMMMPLDVSVEYTDGSKELYYIPLRIMRGEKPAENTIKRIVREDWPWTYPTYVLEIEGSLDKVKKIEIDPSQRMADVNRANNVYEPFKVTKGFEDPTK